MAKRPPLSREEVQRILARLSPLAAERKIVLIGGQAVAWWTYFLGIERGAEEIEIFTSEDIDFEGAARSAKLAAELIGARSISRTRTAPPTALAWWSFTTRPAFVARSTSSVSPIGLRHGGDVDALRCGTRSPSKSLG